MIEIGKKIGKLTILKKDIMTDNGQKWLCQCECGNLTSVREDNLETGLINGKGGTRSCGCLNPVQNHCRGLKRVDRIGEIVNDYQYILRLMPDSNRSYNYLFYDLTNKSTGEQTELYALDYGDISNFLSNTLGTGFLKVGKTLDIVSDKETRLALYAGHDALFLKDKLSLEGDRIDAKFSYNVHYVEKTYGLIPSEFVRVCKNEDIIKLTKKH